MCGRYSLVCIDDLGNRFRVYNPMIGARSRFNVAPGNEMPVIVGNGDRGIVAMQWGLIPHWTKDPKGSPHPINARAESLAEKPMFRQLLKNKRCLVPASGFYEWKKEGTRKVPFYFHKKDNSCFAFAGLYDSWKSPDGTDLRTYTIVTTDANELMAPVHNRMPVILTEENEELWISPTPLAPEVLGKILVPYGAGDLEAYTVSTRVNSPSMDDEALIAQT